MVCIFDVYYVCITLFCESRYIGILILCVQYKYYEYNENTKYSKHKPVG